jgi:DNA polymerase-1
MATAAKDKVKASDFDDAPARDARLFLIDGSSLAFRSFYALPQEIATSDGRPTNALLGFANMLLKLVADYRPEQVVVAWDLGGETKRKQAFPEYKSHRAEMPELLSAQWPHFKPLVDAFGYANVSLQEYEADDVIGTLAARAGGRGIKTCIVTYDRDAMQLVTDNVVVMMTTKGVSEVAVYTPERVGLKFGVAPAQIADLIGLRGDTSDNIPGVPGVGEKTAADLLQKFGSLERVLTSIDEITGAKRKENLRDHADQARMSKELATIVCDLPLELDFDDMQIHTPDREQLLEICRTFEFRTLARRIAEMEMEGLSAPRPLDGGAAPAPEPSTGELVSARMISSYELKQAIAARVPNSVVPIVVRSDGDDALTVAARIEEPVPDGGIPAPWVGVATGSIASIADALTGIDVACFDYKGLPKEILWTRGRPRLTDDLLLASYLLEPTRRTFLPGEIVGELGLTARVAIAGDSDGVKDIAAQAALLPAASQELANRLQSAGMVDLYRRIELPLVEVLNAMERRGVRIDVYRLAEIAHKVGEQIDELRDRAFELAGEEFNLGSPSQLASILFEKMGLPAQRKGKTGYSTDARVLRDLRDMHPIIRVIEQYRELSKLKNTYLDTLPGLVGDKTGRIHTTFSQTTAATGRLSSINPNLQNIPVRTPIGREIRSAFVPTDGNVFISCDYSQVELRLLANVSGEPKLIEVFERGEDVHRSTAAEVAGVDLSEVTNEQRSAAKAVNFGIIYGISSFGLASQLQISREEAQNYIDRYLGRYPQVSDFMERTIEGAKTNGFVTTLFGRRRPIPELKSRIYSTRQLGERLAVNTVLQGTAADIMKIAMIDAHKRLEETYPDAHIVLQIHDELLVESPKEHASEVARIVKASMEGAFEMSPHLAVDVGVGENWLDAK